MHPATGRQKTALGLLQAGPRLPVPGHPIGAQTACRADSSGAAIENERENGRLRPGIRDTPGGATTSRLRIGRTRFHCDAFVPGSTSKGRRKLCQAKSALVARFLRCEQHISRNSAAPAAFGRIQLPIGGSNVVAARETESSGHAVYGLRRAFELEKDSHRCFIQVQMKAGQTKRGAVLLVRESGSEAQRAKDCRPTVG